MEKNKDVKNNGNTVEAEKKYIARVEADDTRGLNEEQVRERKENGYANSAIAPTTKTVGQIIKSNICTYFNLIFILLALALAIVGSFSQMTFLIIVAANTLIGIIQEINAKRTLDKLNLISEPYAVAVRNGKEVKLREEDLVLDDIAVFSAGNQICADGVVTSGEVQVNESLITGESDEITKRKGDNLLSGSFVISGKCKARLTSVGKNSFVSKLTLAAKKTKKKQQPGMMKSLTRLVQCIGIIIIPVGICLFLRQHFSLGLTTKANIEKTTAALIGMIPEGLYLLVSIALAVSVVRLAKKKTLVHDLKCIETLARVDVLCVDKTGTITEDTMSFEGLVPFEDAVTTKAEMENILCDFTGNMNADNNTMEALKNALGKPNYRRAERVVAFSSRTKYSAVSYRENESYILGAPEFILREKFELYRKQIEEYTSGGYRVLLLAHAGKRIGDNIFDYITPLGLVLLANKIRPDAKKTFEYFAKQNVKIKVISGDNPITASNAAKLAGIEGAEKYIDASTLTTTEKMEKAVLEYTVFGRVTPEQKKQFVRILKKAGHTVAMTGDGVNDVLALKEADCSIAMASGSDVACGVSDLVLLNSDFSSMPSVVAEGRRVINNIERSASLFLVKNIFSFVLSLISIFAVFEYPLTPTQLSLISTVTIGIPSFILALEPNENMIKGKFLLNVLYRAFPAALTNLLCVLGVLLFSKAFVIDSAIISTITTLLMGLVGLAVVYKACKPFNEIRVIMFGLVSFLFALAVLTLPKIFGFVPLGLGGYLVLIVFVLLIPTVMKVMSVSITKIVEFFSWLGKKIKNIIKKSVID